VLELIHLRSSSLSLALSCVHMYVLGDLMYVKPMKTSRTGHIGLKCAENDIAVHIGLRS